VIPSTLPTCDFATATAHQLPTRTHRGEKPGRVAHLHTSPHVSVTAATDMAGGRVTDQARHNSARSPASRSAVKRPRTHSRPAAPRAVASSRFPSSRSTWSAILVHVPGGREQAGPAVQYDAPAHAGGEPGGPTHQALEPREPCVRLWC
jgi:hypothetical protein